MLKRQISFVAVELIRPLVGCEVDILQAVIINIADSHTATIVVVEVLDDVEVGAFRQIITKIDAGFGWSQSRHYRSIRAAGRCLLLSAGAPRQ